MREYTTDDYIVTRKGINQANMTISGLSYVDDLEDRILWSLYITIMNGFMGRLFQTVREKHNLVYSCGLFSQNYSCGTVQYSVYAGLLPEKVQFAKELIKELMTQEVTQEELDFAKSKLMGSRSLNLDDKDYVAQLMIESILSGIHCDFYLKDYLNLVNKVTLKDMNSFIDLNDFGNSKLIAVVPEK